MAFKRQTPEEKEKRKQELLKKCEDIINNFQDNPAEIIEYLKFNAKFYQYSKQNNILIYSQNEGARFCASFAKFKEMGYSVKKGEHGMKIFVPYITKLFYDNQAEEWKKISQATTEQKEKIKNNEYRQKEHVSFGIGTVFDIAQTDCPVQDYPKYFGFGHQSRTHRELYNALVSYSEQRGIPVKVKDLKNVFLAGFYSTKDNSITLSDKLQDDRRLSVMTHELSHALLHNNINLNEEISVHQIEFEADAFSLLFREHLGIAEIEPARQSHLQDHYKQYMKWAEENKDTQHCPDISEILENINNTYSDIVEEFDKAIHHYFELHPIAAKEKASELLSIKGLQLSPTTKFTDYDNSISDNRKDDNAHTVLSNSNNFAKTIDDFLSGNINPKDHIFVCHTTKVMKVCGADNLDVMIYQDTIKKILSDDFSKFEHPHNLTPEILKQLPQQLEKPIMVFEGSHKGSIVLITDLQNESSEQIIISCELNSISQRHEINRITSMYGKENISRYLKAQIEKGNLIGCKKNIANQMLQSVGLYLPSEETFIDYTNIIRTIDENVNNQIAEKSSRTHYESAVDEMNHKLSNEVIANLQMFIDSDMQIYGEIQESTLNAIDMQGFKYVNGNLERITSYDFGDGNSLNIDAIKAALSEMSSQEVLEQLDDNQMNMFVEYFELYNDNSEPLHNKLKSLYYDISEYQEYEEYERDAQENNYSDTSQNLMMKSSLMNFLKYNNQLPAEVLKNKSEVQFYSSKSQINDTQKVKSLLWGIHETDMQIVSIDGNNTDGFKIYQLNHQYQVQPYNDTIYSSESEAMHEVFSNSSIAKLVQHSSMELSEYSKDLSYITDSENLKYPYVQIIWSDNTQLNRMDTLSLSEADTLFDEINNQTGDEVAKTSFSLYLDSDNIYNFNYSHGRFGASIPEHIKLHLQELQSQEALDESLTILKDYIDQELPESEQLSFENDFSQNFDTFETT